MAMTKSSVQEYVSGLVAKQRNTTQAAIDLFFNEEFDPTYNTIIKVIVGDVPKYGEKIMAAFDGGLTDKLIKMGWERYNLRDSTNYIRQYADELYNKVRLRFRPTYINAVMTNTDYFDCGDAAINGLVLRLRKDVHIQALVKRRDDINALGKQLSEIISSSQSGKIAYNNMVALDVDMSGYQEPGKNLPAVIKLTADVCLINGGC